ncbi:hypothetical protein BdWA1_000686 [Babesia duncani]|uniref:Uncharacterized protein n=1 Tax=Babesia duncani TaxID=323732 RepID=A0AAD9PNN1_9APIC|nr:hypothetical protein BdWA1_000686 [Babesia duncani]
MVLQLIDTDAICNTINAEGFVKGQGAFPKTLVGEFEIQHGDELIKYNAIVIYFGNAWQVFLSHNGHFAAWVGFERLLNFQLCACRDSIHSETFSVSTLLGDRCRHHYKVYARAFIDVFWNAIDNKEAICAVPEG